MTIRRALSSILGPGVGSFMEISLIGEPGSYQVTMFSNNLAKHPPDPDLRAYTLRDAEWLRDALTVAIDAASPEPHLPTAPPTATL
jgi:hypothetical protein